MAAGDIYRKTPLGTSEMTSRKIKLNPRIRTMLILIDGAQPEFILREEAVKVGAPAVFLDELLSLGLIERSGRPQGSPAAPVKVGAVAANAPSAEVDEFSAFRAAKEFMNVTIVDALGIKSFFFTLKLERAGTRADLSGLAEAYRQAIAKADGEAQAEVLATRLDEMLR